MTDKLTPLREQIDAIDAQILFEASTLAGSGKTYRLESRAVWQSAASDCDACLLRRKGFADNGLEDPGA